MWQRILCVVAILLLAHSANAHTVNGETGHLHFYILPSSTGKNVLLIDDYDCSRSRQITTAEDAIRLGPTLCGPGGQFGPGDESLLEDMIREYRTEYSEVWLRSNGGNVSAGIGIGRLLRRYGQFVRVPENARCISSCTIAFIGGMVRQVDSRNTVFGVHKMSSSGAILDQIEHLRAYIRQYTGRTASLGEALELACGLFAGDGEGSKFRSNLKLFNYYLEMFGESHLPRSALGSLGSSSERYCDQQSSQEALREYQVRGDIALEEWTMRLERDISTEFLRHISRDISRRSSGYEYAFNLFDTMVISEIVRVNGLDSNELTVLGIDNTLGM